MAQDVQARYFVEAAAKALDVLESFSTVDEELTTTEVVRRAGMGYCSTFRILYTLEQRGYVMRVPGSKRYRLVPPRKRYRVGYASVDGGGKVDEVARGLILAARASGVELLVRDQGSNAANILANVDALLDDGIQLLIVSQPHDCAAEAISIRCSRVGVPVIALDHQHPGSAYFGADHAHLGRMCADDARRRAPSERARILVLSPAPGNHARTEFLRGFVETRRAAGTRVVGGIVPAAGRYQWIRQALSDFGRAREQSLVVALSDSLFLDCLRALPTITGAQRPMLLGVGGSQESISQLRSAGPGVALLARFPETWGDRVLAMAVRILEGRPAGLGCHPEPVFLAADNVEDYYPDRGPSRAGRTPVLDCLFSGTQTLKKKAG